MRKLMLLAAMLAMVLVVAAPAFGQAIVVSDDEVDNSITQEVSSEQIQVAEANQVNTGDANAAADDGSAEASISQDLSIEQSAVQNTVAAGDDAFVFGNTGGFFWFWF